MALENQTTMPHFQNSSSSDGSSPVTFVSESSKSEVRSHAMRHHWRRRQRRNSEIKLHHKQTCRKLLPGPMVKAQVSKPKKNDTNGLVGRQRDNFNIEDDQGDDDQVGVYKQSDFSIALQLLRGFDHALSTSTFDPFQTCPIQLTPQHHKLLHHWISTHAAMMFEDLNITDFNPMKDVWFPLDLSNASSFNCVMAHSAAHIAHLYSGTSSGRETSSSDALMFKAEAVRILNLWLADPGKKLSDDAFAAVIRLLTFERYWGTEAEWNVHRNGLKGMIEAKGGVENLHDNWRLELVVYLVSLMAKPSWLESTNNLGEISNPSLRLTLIDPCLDIQKVRCLWLISFIQDMRTFMGSFPSFYGGLSSFPSIYDAVLLLRYNCQLTVANDSHDQAISILDHDRLACLFSISVLMQESISPLYDTSSAMPIRSNTLAILDKALAESESIWKSSIENLRSVIFQTLVRFQAGGEYKVNYIMELADVLSTLSLDARRGVEKCLLNMICHSANKGTKLLIDDGWTPDSLLSSIRGQ